ncbi:MAG: ABC transporter permease [Gammaproteobacteria bacterium]|nr:ABC transporter permease [Gammaproteobacteria bacterium]
MIRRSIEKTGQKFIEFSQIVGMMGIFLYQCLLQILTPPYKLSAVIKQVHFIGFRSIIIITFTGLFTGMVLALQGYHNLKDFGSTDILGSAVGLGLIQELGPVLTALMVIGRAGSAICAEIGIMRHSEQIDALECMGIDPYRFLIVPKFIAAMISLPILTFIFDVVGIFGGYVVGVLLMGVSEGSYFQGMYDSVDWADVQLGLVKSFIFAILIIWIATFKGYFLHILKAGNFGAEGVSRVTTDTVVLSSVVVLASDYLIGSVMLN